MRLFFCVLCLWVGSVVPAEAQALKWIATAVRSKTPTAKSSEKPAEKPLYGEKQVDLKPVLVEEKNGESKPAEPQKKTEPGPKKSAASVKLPEKSVKKQEPAPVKTPQSEEPLPASPTAPEKKEPEKKETSESAKKSVAPKKKEPVVSKRKSEEKKAVKKTESAVESSRVSAAATGKKSVTEPVAKAEPVAVKSQEVPPATGGAVSAVSAAGAAPGNLESIPGAAVFRPGDVFELRLSGMPAEDALPFSLQFTIGTDGFVNIPLGGLVRAAGLTQSQLESAIERRLVEKEIFTRPTATINVAPQSRFVTVGGQVRVPQRLPWTADLTLLSAISAVGGPADFAGGKIKLTRAGKVEVFTKKDLDRHPDKDPRLLPGDQIEQL